jgi:Protein of unknown function (DUF4058)
MPLRDHFSENVPKSFHWEGFHQIWVASMVRRLNRGLLPSRYHAAPHIRLGTYAEIDVGTRQEESVSVQEMPNASDGAVATYSPPKPQLTFEADLSREDVFEIQVFDDELGQNLVAAVELISPANKDRPQSRHEFVVKCASLLKADISLVLIDIVTTRRANLFKELMEYLEIRKPANPIKKHLYCCSLLPSGSNGHARVDVWPETLQVGAVLPILPLWLRDDLAVPLELESTYEEACGDLGA